MTNNNGLLELPSKWVWTTIGEACETTSGGTPSRKIPSYYDGNILWLKSGELGDSLIHEIEESITEAGLQNSSAKIFPKGTLLIALYGATVGKLGILGVDAATNQAVCAIFPPDGLDNKYLFWFLRKHRDELLKARIGGAQPNISQTILRTVNFPLPPFPEQQRIVAKIEELFTQLDAGVAELKQAKAQLKRYRQSVLTAAVEGELTREWRETHQDELEPAEVLLARILKERRAKWEEEQWKKEISKAQQKASKAARKAAGRPLKRGEKLTPEEWQDTPEDDYARYLPKNEMWKAKYKKPVPPDTDDLPELPEGWVWCTVGQIAEHRLGKMLDKAKNKGTQRPYLRNINVRWFGFDLSDIQYMRVMDEEMDNISVRAGDLVVCEGGEPGRAAVWEKPGEPKVIQKALHRIRPSKGISPWCLAYRLAADASTGILEKYFTGSTIKHFTGQSLHSYVFPLPPTLEQQRIIANVEHRLSVADEIEKELDQALAHAGRLRQSILKRAFDGKLVPQVPNDEPASVLLERLRVHQI